MSSTIRTLRTLAKAKGLTYAGMVNAKDIDRILRLHCNRVVKARLVRDRRNAWVQFCNEAL